MFHHHLRFHIHIHHHLHFHIHLHIHIHFLLFYFLLSHIHFHLDFLILMFCQLKLYQINQQINLIILFLQGYTFYTLLFLLFLFRLMHLKVFSIYFTNCIIFNIINQVFNVSILKFTNFIFVTKFIAVNNS